MAKLDAEALQLEVLDDLGVRLHVAHAHSRPMGVPYRQPSAAGPTLVSMSGESTHLGDAQGEWYYCFKHKKVETNADCHEMDRMGPYPTREDAENWRERVAARNEAWGDEDE